MEYKDYNITITVRERGTEPEITREYVMSADEVLERDIVSDMIDTLQKSKEVKF